MSWFSLFVAPLMISKAAEISNFPAGRIDNLANADRFQAVRCCCRPLPEHPEALVRVLCRRTVDGAGIQLPRLHAGIVVKEARRGGALNPRTKNATTTTAWGDSNPRSTALGARRRVSASVPPKRLPPADGGGRLAHDPEKFRAANQCIIAWPVSLGDYRPWPGPEFQHVFVHARDRPRPELRARRCPPERESQGFSLRRRPLSGPDAFGHAISITAWPVFYLSAFTVRLGRRRPRSIFPLGSGLFGLDLRRPGRLPKVAGVGQWGFAWVWFGSLERRLCP